MKNFKKIIELLEQDDDFENDILRAIGEKAKTPECIDVLDMLYHNGYGVTKSLYEGLTNIPPYSVMDHKTMKTLNLLTSYFIARYISENNESDFKVIDYLSLSGSSDAVALLIGKPVNGLDYTPNLFTIEVDMRTDNISTLVDAYGGVCYLIPESVTSNNEMKDKLKVSHSVKTAMDQHNVRINDSIIDEAIEFHNKLKDVINIITGQSDVIYEKTKCDYKYAGKRLYYDYNMRAIGTKNNHKELNDMTIEEIQDFIDSDRYLKLICLNELKKDGNYEYARNKCILEMLITVGHQGIDEMLEIIYPEKPRR